MENACPHTASSSPARYLRDLGGANHGRSNAMGPFRPVRTLPERPIRHGVRTDADLRRPAPSLDARPVTTTSRETSLRDLFSAPQLAMSRRPRLAMSYSQRSPSSGLPASSAGRRSRLIRSARRGLDRFRATPIRRQDELSRLARPRIRPPCPATVSTGSLLRPREVHSARAGRTGKHASYGGRG